MAARHAPAVAMVLAVVVVAEIAWPAFVLAGSDEGTARAALDDGSARAALIVDLEGSVDRLLLASANDDTLDAATHDRVEQTDESLGRTVDVETVAPPDADKRRGAARLAVALALLLGFLLAVGTSLRDGPVSRTHLRALRRTLVIGSASVVGGCGSSASLRRSPQRCSRSPSSCPAPERPPPPRGLARRDRGLRRLLRVRDLGSTTSL